MKRVNVLGYQLETLDIPAAQTGTPALVLLHEGLGSIALWREFPQQLAAATGCRTVAYSRVGYGQSDAYAEARTARYMHREGLEMLPAFLAAMGIEKPVLVGHSDGASISLIHAGAQPDGLSGLVVMAPHEFVEEETMAGIRAACTVWEKTDWRQRLARYHQNAERVFHDWNDTWLSPEFRDWNIEEYLPSIRCPVLAIQGEDDEYATMRQIDVIAERVPGTRLLKLASCGHSPHRDQNERVAQAIAEFVRGLQ